MMGPAPHTQLDADLASGMGMPDNGPKLSWCEISIFGIVGRLWVSWVWLSDILCCKSYLLFFFWLQLQAWAQM